jgi:hypothetical protein
MPPPQRRPIQHGFLPAAHDAAKCRPFASNRDNEILRTQKKIHYNPNDKLE